jgi:hypothetical protein
MLRTRGLVSPLTMTADWSAGHFQMPRFYPQYGHIGLWVMSWLGSQLAGSYGLYHWSQPVTHVLAIVEESYGLSLA